MSLGIRLYTEADYPALLQIQRECFPPTPEEQLWSLEQIRSSTGNAGGLAALH